MTSNRLSLRLGTALLTAFVATAAPAAAQTIRMVYSPSQFQEDAGDALTRHLRTLSDSPRNVNALVGAAQASFQLGDPESALTFFGRAEEISPRDIRVKAGMGACFVLMEQPALSLKYFADAGTLSGDARTYIGHRGLAHDLTGNNRQAQADYREALRAKEEWVVRERLALSLAIAGDQAGALKAIDSQLRRSDRAAWRVRAFILALGGDAAGATEAARAVVPATAAQLQPFFARLPQLTPAERAMAVHFGHMPADGAPVRTADAGRYAARAASRPAATPPPPVPQQPVSTPPAASRQPATTVSQPSRPASQGRQAWIDSRGGSIDRERPPKPASRAATPPPSSASAAVTPPIRQSRPLPTAASNTPTGGAELASASATPVPPPRTISETSVPPATAPTTTAVREPAPGPARSAPAPKQRIPFGPPIAPPETAPSRFADIAALLKTLPDPPAAARAAPAKAAPVEATPAKATAKTPAKKVTPAPAKEPSRIWVQIAGGANAAALPREYGRLKDKAPDLFKGKSPWTTPLKATNRLLVGPFKTEEDAQSFVNDLTKAGLSGFSWTSDEGQAIAKLATG